MTSGMSHRTPAELTELARSSGMRRVLVVTALPLEMEAVEEHLNPLGTALGCKGTVYETGTFVEGAQELLVVVCVTGAGTHPAQRAALVAHHDFDGFDLQMVVGIGGSRKATAPIGSVVAADRVYWPYSGKAAPQGWSNRPREFSAQARLVEIARMVCRHDAWQGRAPAGSEVADTASRGGSVEPLAVAQVAPIASVEAVLDDPESDLEAHLAANCGDAHVVEMEGYGAAFAAYHSGIPSIVVRGVSDKTKEKSEEAGRQASAPRGAPCGCIRLRVSEPVGTGLSARGAGSARWPRATASGFGRTHGLAQNAARWRGDGALRVGRAGCRDRVLGPSRPPCSWGHRVAGSRRYFPLWPFCL